VRTPDGGGPRRVGEPSVGGGLQSRNAVVDVEGADPSREQLQAALSVALRVCFWFKFQLERKKKERKSEVLFFCARKLEKKKN